MLPTDNKKLNRSRTNQLILVIMEMSGGCTPDESQSLEGATVTSPFQPLYPQTTNEQGSLFDQSIIRIFNTVLERTVTGTADTLNTDQLTVPF